MYKVMIRDNMSPLAAKILEDTGEIEVVVDNDKGTNDPQALSGIIAEFDGLAVRSGTKVKAQAIEKAEKLKVIGRAGIGVDNIDVPFATARGIVVMNAPGGNTVTTAEHTISHLLALARHIPQATASIRDGKWEKKKFMGVEITGKVLGIIGLGQIGRVVADRARGLKMQVIASDPLVTEEAARALGVELVEIEELLSRSDFISLHVPRLEETKNLIRTETIEKMKPGVRIINCSRGEVVNLDDLYQALESGQVAGAALDVFPQEPPEAWPILKHPHVIFTPHLGASTGEAQEKVAEMIARQMVDYLINGVIINAVNFPSLPREVMDQLRPYLNLAERMGSLMGQLTRGLHAITVTYSGEVAQLDTRPLTHAVLKGLLGAFTDQPVNFVSAPAIAKDKGIKVEETISQVTHDYTSLIQIKLEDGDEGGLNEIWGTIFGKEYPRIVRLGRIYMDAIPEGSVLVIRNHDQPGVIGNIGTTLAHHGVNIGRFQLGRRQGKALCMVNIDSPVDDDIVEEIQRLPNIISVRQIQLD